MRRSVPERSVLGLRDLVAEALAGTLQRPLRSAFTALGTVFGVGAFVAVLGLTSTAQNQIGQHFDATRDTTVTVTDVGNQEGASTGPQASNFPRDSDQRIGTLHGAVAAGVYWQVPLRTPVISATPRVGSDRTTASSIKVYAASAGLFPAMHVTLAEGRVYDAFHDKRAEPVAILGRSAANQLGVTQLSARPAIFIDGRAFTVVGIINDTQRLPETLLGIMIPRGTVERDWGGPDVNVSPATMIIQTNLGAAPLLARQAPVALRPDNATVFAAAAPPDPRSLYDSVNTDISTLFLILAAICLVIGAVGITNTTLVAILERVGEIGLRRALGARPRHVAAQFLAESTGLGLMGGLVGTSLGVATVVAIALAKHWTAVLDPLTVLPSPFIGALIGLLAGIYPSVRAAMIEPVEALRR